MILRYGLTVPPQYVMVGRTFMTLEGSVRLCAPDLEILSEIGLPFVIHGRVSDAAEPYC